MAKKKRSGGKPGRAKPALAKKMAGDLKKGLRKAEKRGPRGGKDITHDPK
jgi:hypothetical protein